MQKVHFCAGSSDAILEKPHGSVSASKKEKSKITRKEINSTQHEDFQRYPNNQLNILSEFPQMQQASFDSSRQNYLINSGTPTNRDRQPTQNKAGGGGLEEGPKTGHRDLTDSPRARALEG